MLGIRMVIALAAMNMPHSALLILIRGTFNPISAYKTALNPMQGFMDRAIAIIPMMYAVHSCLAFIRIIQSTYKFASK